MAIFNILHLTDLHWGLPIHESRFPNIRTSFFDDLEKIKHTGPWDLVLFSGDLVQSGEKEQFQSLNRLLDTLWQQFNRLGSTPLLLAVPGNHDLFRPDENDPISMLLTRLAKDEDAEKIWSALLDKQDSAYRKLVGNAFSAYSEWWKSTPHKASATCYEGVLPGDFVATLEKDGIKLGIAGLNSTFLQLTNANFEGKLAMDVRQFHNAAKNAGEEDGESWVKKHHACLLVTHQPPSWLEASNRTAFNQLIAKSENFIAQFCGHLHKAEAESTGRGFSEDRRLIQGGSLFGFGDKDKLVSAYTACRIEINKSKPRGTIRIWPRIVKTRQDDSLSFSPDTSFKILEDNGTRAVEFGLNIFDEVNDPEPSAQEVEIPDIPPLPEIDQNALYNKQFIGREDLLRDVKYSLRNIGNENKGGLYEEEAKLIWIHGFGGMGKSWFLRKVSIEAGGLSDKIKVALIDWYIPEWHEPAVPPFNDPKQLFDAIGFRLAQLYGAENLAKFWIARKQVQEYAEQYRELRTSLELSLDLLEVHGPNWRSEFTDIIRKMLSSTNSNENDNGFKQLRNLESTLMEQALWSEDKLVLQKIIREVKKYLSGHDLVEDNSTESYRNILPAWIYASTRSEDIALQRPYLFLARILQECIKDLCAETPLMIALDTCEVLPTAVDEWLRKIFIPLINDKTPILLLIGSRHKPDLHINPGLNRGWKVEVNSTRFRFMPFYEELRFDVNEITRAIETAGIVYYSDDLPYLLHRVTLGVPLALGVILQLHADGDNVLDEIEQLKIDAIDELNVTRAVSKVIETISRRFLLHLEGRREKLQDYKNVIVLALLQYYKIQTLTKFWGDTLYIPILKTLGRRYALLADGDLHPTVQEFLRRFWREQPNELIIETANSLLAVLHGLRPEATFEHKEFIDWKLEELNLFTWTKGEVTFDELVKSLVMFLIYGIEIDKLIDIAKACPVTRTVNAKAREIFLKVEKGNYYSWASRFQLDTETLLWIKNNFAARWDLFENSCLELLIGINFSYTDEHERAVDLFIKCFSVFKEDLKKDIPRKDFIVQTFLSSIAKLDQSKSGVAEKGLQVLRCHGLIEIDTKWNHDYYWLLHNSKRYQEAADYCRFIIYHDSDSTEAIAFLGHNLHKHLGKLDEAEVVYREALARFPDDPNLHRFMALLYQDKAEPENALVHFQKAYENVWSESNKDECLLDVCKVLIHLQRLEEAHERFNKVSFVKSTRFVFESSYQYSKREMRFGIETALRISSKLIKNQIVTGKVEEARMMHTQLLNIIKHVDHMMDDNHVLNSLAWQQYILGDLSDAERNAIKSFNLDIANINTLQTLVAILIRRGKWDEARPKLTDWVRRIELEDVREGWEDFRLMFVDISKQGYSEAFVEILRERNDDDIWSLLREGLSNGQIPDKL